MEANMKRLQAIRPGDFASEKRVRRSASGFTLVELLVVIAIIGVLVALLLPAVQAAREAARRTQCLNNMKQINTGLHLYHDSYKIFPGSEDPHGRQNHNYMVRILPYVELGNIHDQYNYNIAWNAGTNALLTTGEDSNISVQLCPSSEHEHDGQGDYSAIDGTRTYTHNRSKPADWITIGWGPGYSYPLGVLVPINGTSGTDRNSAVSIGQVTDGTANTFYVGEAAGRKGSGYHWADGENAFAQHGVLNIHPENEMYSDHPGGLHIAMADGSARFLSEFTSLRIVDFLATRALGEVIDEDF